MAFASPTDMATRLGRSFTEAETGSAAALLDDASGYLISELGGQLIEAGTTTVELRVDPAAGLVRLPQQPVRAVNSVELNDSVIADYEVSKGSLKRLAGWPPEPDRSTAKVVVDFAYGYTEIPSILKTYTIILAAGALAQARRGSLSSAGVQSERIDDYSVTYEAGSGTFELPERVLNKLRASFGVNAFVTSG